MENIHERFREEMEARADALSQLKEGSEEHKRAADEYTAMYKLALEHEKIDEEINDRRCRIEDDKEIEHSKIRSTESIENKKMWSAKRIKSSNTCI